MWAHVTEMPEKEPSLYFDSDHMHNFNATYGFRSLEVCTSLKRKCARLL